MSSFIRSSDTAQVEERRELPSRPETCNRKKLAKSTRGESNRPDNELSLLRNQHQRSFSQASMQFMSIKHNWTVFSWTKVIIKRNICSRFHVARLKLKWISVKWIFLTTQQYTYTWDKTIISLAPPCYPYFESSNIDITNTNILSLFPI